MHTPCSSVKQVSTSSSQYSLIQDSHKGSYQSDIFSILLHGVVEDYIDGILLLTDQGELIHANSSADRICRQLNSHSNSKNHAIPQAIWRSCQALIATRDAAKQPAVMEDEIRLGESIAIRIRVRWLRVNSVDRPCLLITLEDQYQSTQYKAIAEARKYHLTNREAEVWLLKGIGYTYRAIAAKLHIAEDTVKKHIKSIHAKREAVEWNTAEC